MLVDRRERGFSIKRSSSIGRGKSKVHRCQTLTNLQSIQSVGSDQGKRSKS